MFERILFFGINHRVLTLMLILAISLAAIPGLMLLEVDTGLSSMMPDNNPERSNYDRIISEFGSDNQTIIYIGDQHLWTTEKLAALEKLHYEFAALPFVERVDSLYNLRTIRNVDDKLVAHVLLHDVPKDATAIADAKSNALANPLFVGNFISRDGNVTALNIAINEDTMDGEFDQKAYMAMEQILISARHNFTQAFQVGSPRINSELKHSLFADLQVLVPLSTGVLVLAIIFFLKSGFAALVPLFTSALSILWTFGMMGWTQLPINILTAMLPSLVVVIGSTEDTHMLSCYLQKIAMSADNRRPASTIFMMKYMGIPLLLSILTTSLGFASNTFSDIGLIRDFAMAATFAMIANGIVTILVVPMILATFGPKRTHLFNLHNEIKGLPDFIVRFFSLTINHFSRTTLVITMLLCTFFLYHATRLHATNDPLSYFRETSQIIQHITQIHEDLAGMKVFYITLEAEQEQAFQHPNNIKKLKQIQEFLKSQEIYDMSISLADMLALTNQEFNTGNNSFYNVPNTRELVAQYLLFFQRPDLEHYVSHDFKRVNIIVRHNISDSNTLNRYVSELRNVVARIAGTDMKSFVVGENLMINAAAENLMVAQMNSLGILILVIFLMMSIMFTSFKGGFIALIANLIPIIVLFGAMGFFGIPLNPGTAMVAVIAIGISIDDTIHLLSRYNEECRRTSNSQNAVQATLHAEAIPIITTSISLVLGFGVLLFSNFTVIAQFGALSAVTMLLALISTLLITPIVMARVRLVGLSQILSIKLQQTLFENSSLFTGMTNYQVRKAILISELHEYKKGDILVKQDAIGRSMYLILTGSVEVLRNHDNNTVVLATLNAGQIFGEIGYVKAIRRTADIRALNDVEVLIFDYKKMQQNLQFFPHIVAQLNFNISRILGERLADAVQELAAKAQDKVLSSRNS